MQRSLRVVCTTVVQQWLKVMQRTVTRNRTASVASDEEAGADIKVRAGCFGTHMFAVTFYLLESQ